METLTKIEIWSLAIAVLLRFVRSIQVASRKRGFKLSGYFTLNTCLAWLVHVTSSVLYIYLLPFLIPIIQAILQRWFNFTLPDNEGAKVIMVAIIGYSGYDIFRFIENMFCFFRNKYNKNSNKT